MMEKSRVKDQVAVDYRAFYCWANGEPNKGLSSNRELRWGNRGSRRADLKKGTWYDYETGKGGDIFNAVMDRDGHNDFARAIETIIVEYLCLSEDERRSQVRAYVPKRIQQTEHDDLHWRVNFGNQILEGCRPAGPNSEPIKFLIGRSIDPSVIDPDVVLFHPNLFYSKADPRSFPAMVVKARDANWNVVGLQRTYLQDGKKAPVATARLAWRMGPKPMKGTVWLTKPRPEVMSAEGFEDAGAILTARPAWGACATLGTSGLASITFPPGVKTVLLCGDNDAEKIDPRTGLKKGRAGLKAIMKAARKLSLDGYKVLIAFPPPGYKDFNELLEKAGVEAVRSCLDNAEEYVARAEEFRSKPAFLQTDQRLRKKIRGIEVVPQEEAPERPSLLIPGQVSQAVLASIKEAFDVGFASRQLAPTHQTATVVQFPAGSGKTVTIFDVMASHPELRKPVPVPTGRTDADGKPIMEEKRLPVFVLAPMHKLTKEMLKVAKQRGLKAMVLFGKEDACERKKEVSELHNANLSSAGLCVDPRDKTKLCAFYEWCRYQRMKREIEDHDVVILAHNWLTINPVILELARPRFVIVDESFWETTLRISTMPLDTLALSRFTDKEFDDMSDKEQARHLARKKVAKTALSALENGKCAAEAILAAGQEDLVDMAKRAAGGSDFGTEIIHPGLTICDVRRIAGAHRQTHGRSEAAFWRAIKTRIEALQARETVIQAGAGDRLPPLPENLSIRVHVELVNGEARRTVRTAYHAELNWKDTNFLAIDAHAHPLIAKAMWPEYQIKWQKVDAVLNAHVVQIADHSYSNSSVIAGPFAGEKRLREASTLLGNIREAIKKISEQHEKLIVITTKKIKRALRLGWKPPANTRFATFGALRGLDRYKHFEGCLVVGRMQLPTIAIDDATAALWNGEGPTPEWLDPGNGEDSNLPYGDAYFLMKNGETLRTRVQIAPHPLQNAILQQRRECELEQAIARLRLIFRELPGAIYLMTNVPTSILVDEVISIHDLIGTETPLMAAMRVAGGVLLTTPDMLVGFDGAAFEKAEDARNALRAAGLTLNTLTAAAEAATLAGMASQGQSIDSIAEKSGNFAVNNLHSESTTLSMNLLTVRFRWHGLRAKGSAALIDPTLPDAKAALRAALSRAGKELDEESFEVLFDPSVQYAIPDECDDEPEDEWVFDATPSEIEERLAALEIAALSAVEIAKMRRSAEGRKALADLDSWSLTGLRAFAANLTMVADARADLEAKKREEAKEREPDQQIAC